MDSKQCKQIDRLFKMYLRQRPTFKDEFPPMEAMLKIITHIIKQSA